VQLQNVYLQNSQDGLFPRSVCLATLYVFLNYSGPPSGGSVFWAGQWDSEARAFGHNMIRTGALASGDWALGWPGSGLI